MVEKNGDYVSFGRKKVINHKDNDIYMKKMKRKLIKIGRTWWIDEEKIHVYYDSDEQLRSIRNIVFDLQQNRGYYFNR